jgi:polysaccharide pyruvyl transferase CsaB
MAVLICGYYGEHNLGDDALLAVLLQQLPQGCRPVVTARDQQQVRRLFGVQTTDRTRLAAVLRALAGCDALVLGGGSLLQDATSLRSLIYYAVLMAAARLQGKPVVLWAQGLGPLRRRRSRALVRALLPQATAISWRDGASAALARSWGVEALVGSDPVWSMARRGPWHGAGGPLVLCWRPVAQLSAPGWASLLQALDRLAPDRPVLWSRTAACGRDSNNRGWCPNPCASAARKCRWPTPRLPSISLPLPVWCWRCGCTA